MNVIEQRNNKQVAIWLFVGVGMIFIQVLLGGITRLTESGLSITQWKPITGILPPLNNAAWQIEFDKYKLTDQFKYVHQNFSLSHFKFIFFWEWFHRLWARLMGMVFLVGFFYFLLQKRFSKKIIGPLVLLFVLGALQGAIGWLMVKSGLVPAKYFVGHVELATHFMAALVLLCYTLWFALSLVIKPQQRVINSFLKKWIIVILITLFFQLIYGAFMAGLKAAVVAPTWPSINGSFIPATINELSPWAKNWVDNILAVHFIHRGLAYLLFLFIIIGWLKSRLVSNSKLFKNLRKALLGIVFVQVLLGIATVLNATYTYRLIVLGVLHQMVAMLLLMCVVSILFLLKNGGK